MMRKKVLALFLCAAISIFPAACVGTDSDAADAESTESVLSADAANEDILAALSEDIHVVTDEDYIETVTALAEDADLYSGQIYQLEGVYVLENGEPYITRTLVHGNDTSSLGLPITLLEKDIQEGTWIRITGIINCNEENGVHKTVIEEIVTDIADAAGQEELPWDGK